MSEALTKVRLDKWLWAARFFRTRSLATAAAEAGRIQIAGERAKPAKLLKAGDRLEVRIGPYRWDVTVTALADRRGSAAVARTLYTESETSLAERLVRIAEIRASRPGSPLWRGRPTKKLRRDFDRATDGHAARVGDGSFSDTDAVGADAADFDASRDADFDLGDADPESFDDDVD
jgi:ribosome-associated heat shock protein Hsp15